MLLANTTPNAEPAVSPWSLLLVNSGFSFFFLPYHSFLIFVLQSFSSALSSRSFVGRAHIGKLGKQIAVRPNLVLRHPPVCEDCHERVTGVVGERATIAREGCAAGGIIGHHIGQQAQRRSPCPLWRYIHLCARESVRRRKRSGHRPQVRPTGRPLSLSQQERQLARATRRGLSEPNPRPRRPTYRPTGEPVWSQGQC